MIEDFEERGEIMSGCPPSTQVSRINLATGAGIRTEPAERPRSDKKSRLFIGSENSSFW
jgi:hypothetical protein